jgi:hypothetical protein
MDAILDKSSDGFISEHVLADTRDERDLAARASSRNRLIGALAPGSGAKLAAEDRFARRRDPFELDDHVGIRAADDEDSRLFHRFD